MSAIFPKPARALFTALMFCAVGVAGVAAHNPAFSATDAAAVKKIKFDAATMNKKSFQVQGEYRHYDRKIILNAFTGCMSSTGRMVSHDIKVDVENATININGHLFTRKYMVGTTDCGGAVNLKFTVDNMKQRRYHVVVNRTYAGVMDFTNPFAKQPMKPAMHNLPEREVPSRRNMKNRYAPVDITGWKVKRAEAVLDLFKPITDSHPEGVEGRPEMVIKMSKNPKSANMMVSLTLLGLLDDSVAGLRYVADVQRVPWGWDLKSLWRLQMCGRGKKAGQWTKGACG